MPPRAVAGAALLLVGLTLATGCGLFLQVKLTPPEAQSAARATLAPAYAEWSNVEMTLRPRVWVVTFRNVKATPEALGWPDAEYPRGRAATYRDATVYLDADTGGVLKKELTP